MIWALIPLAVVIGLIGVQLFLHRKTKSTYLALTEYWIFQNGDKMFDQSKLLDRMVGKNPYQKRGGRAPIGPNEGIILSDIRLHMALVLRSKNPITFRPDLFANAEPTAQQLQCLADANSLIKLRYASELPLKDHRHLQFLIHAADATCDLMDGTLIYDVSQERLINPEEMHQWLSDDPDGSRVGLHVRERWSETPGGHQIETLGLRKIGFEELTAETERRDQKLIVGQLLEDAVSDIWNQTILPGEVVVQAHEDSFRLVMHPSPKGKTQVQILRRQTH